MVVAVILGFSLVESPWRATLVSAAVAALLVGAWRAASRVLAASRRQERILREVVERQRRDTHVVHAIAGTTGRTAPQVRAIRAALEAQPPMPVVTQVAAPTKKPAPQRAPDRFPTFPPLLSPGGDPRRGQVRAAVILDEFSASAFEPEWDQLPVTPTGWRQELDEFQPDLLFVESAWNGNDGAWLYHVVGTSAPRPALVDLVEECKRRGIPAVFWNKEDPPHFEDFLDTARLFDHVFTTDVNCVDEYRERLGHDRVGVLAFAAQARVHNPARPGKVLRDREVAFGGMYFRHKYPERRRQLEFLLPAAAKHQLDIFSRHSGGNEDYLFPAPYDGFVRGSLSYPEMLHAYHRYKIFLNVNSVVDSPSMCARRIFEVTASGASIVTPPSPAVRTFFPHGEITTVATEMDAKHAFRGLLRSEEFRQRQVHLAQRRIWEENTYTHRVGQVLEAAGIADPISSRSVSLIAPTIRPQNVSMILENAARQRGAEVELVVLSHGFELEKADVEARAKELGIESLVLLKADKDKTLGHALNRLVDAASGDLVSKIDDDDYYGPNYLRDLVNAHYFSEAEVVGKAASYIYFESQNATVISYEAHEHRYTDFVRGATLTGARDIFRKVGFDDVPRSEDSRFLRKLSAEGGRVYAADRFNFVIRRSAQPGAHTWQVGDDELFSSGRFVLTGSPIEHVSI
ncbi:glycosyltransferase [Isoptericola sp. 4D.3]|uniref:Glycosyltransferase n=1 Tax=Isoptericola peretonis TaxID=2918523 RepID=A0ABT0J5C2_9MICO|nr:glycosyltransferase [Isoptericola sp. 4D.3]